MSAQDVILGARVAHVRELKVELERMKGENAALRDEINSLRAHFSQALLAAHELGNLPDGGKLEIWDGWNLVLGSARRAKDRDELLELARRKLAAAGSPISIWIVFDGPDERVAHCEPGLRVSYTGGTGSHRADRFVCDFVRMAVYLGLGDRVSVVTDDRDFMRAIRKMTVSGKYDILSEL